MGTPQEVTERIVGLAEHGDANTVQIGFNRGAMRQEMFFGTDPPLHPRRAADRAGTPGEPRTGSRGDQGALTGSRKDNNNGEAFSGSYAATGADPDAMATQHLDVAHGNPVVALFSDGYALRTIMLWIMFLASMLSLYLIGVWLPTVLHLEGCHPLTQCSRPALRCRMRPERISILGPLVTGFGLERVFTICLACGIVRSAGGRRSHPAADVTVRRLRKRAVRC